MTKSTMLKKQIILAGCLIVFLTVCNLMSVSTARADDVPLPPIPSNFIANVGGCPLGIGLMWKCDTEYVTGFEVHMSDGESDTYYRYQALAGVSVYNKTISNVNDGHEYHLTIRARGPGGDSDWSQEVIVVAGLYGPWNLTLSSYSTDSIDLHWEVDPETTADGYIVERCDDKDSPFFTEIARVEGSPDGGFYHDASVREGPMYTYRIKACKGRLVSLHTSLKSSPTLPYEPIGLAVESIGEGAVSFHYYDDSNCETGFYAAVYCRDGTYFERYVYGGLGGSGTMMLASVTGLQEGMDYSISVVAENSAGRSHESIPIAVPGKLFKPINFIATPVSENTIRLSWENRSKEAFCIVIEMDYDGVGNGFHQIMSVPADMGTYEVKNLAPSSLRYFRLYAAGSREGLAQTSDYTEIESAKTFPAAPEQLEAKTLLDGYGSIGIALTWADEANPRNGIGYWYFLEIALSNPIYPELPGP